MTRRVGMMLIALGIALTICAGAWLARNEREEQNASESAEAALLEIEEALDTKPSETTGATSQAEQASAEDMPVIIVDGVAYIGTLSIPELGLELPVQAECSEEKLKNTPCRYSGSLTGGDLVIAGHNYKRHFSPVKNLKPGARVLFRDARNRDCEFTVIAAETVSGTDVQGMISGGGDWDLTLFTCTYGGQNRIAIRCKEIK